MQKLIEQSGLTIKEFSELYEIPYNTVRQWANGIRKAPEWVKKLIENIIKSRSKGQEQLKIQDLQNYFVEIIHPASNKRIYSRIITYKEYLEFELNHWYVEYIKNKEGYKVNYYMLKEI